MNPWARLGPLAALMQLAYVADASVRLWRSDRSDLQNRALVIGGGFAFFFGFGTVQAALVANGTLRMPTTVCMSFLFLVFAMGYKLGSDGVEAIQLARDLHESEERMKLATDAAHLGIWTHDLVLNKIWATDKWRELFGIGTSQPLEIDVILPRLHPEDSEAAGQIRDSAIKNGTSYETEYRVLHPDGRTRWIASRGNVELNALGKAILLRGVSQDITERKHGEAENQRLRAELAHLSRVNILGELTGTLAHELNQPLAAILSNSQVGQRCLQYGQADLSEIAAILDDITSDAKRAGGVIHSVRALFKKDLIAHTVPVDLNSAVRQVLTLLRSEILARKARVEFIAAESLPLGKAVRVEIQQVLINLLVNGLDAIGTDAKNEEGATIEISTTVTEGYVVVSVRDHGPGIACEVIDRLFEPFASTKPDGLGLGLAISRRIMVRFSGKLVAENHPEGGAVFRMLLPVAGV
ncbi:MAG: PAS domain S-box protein [Verrucomicrobia bacterium]|nr:PAS domain S-box protein [Verrucomicrobiota bacterium]